MIKVLYVGGKEVSIPELQGKNVHVDYVQNGMIALSAVQTSDFDAVIIENELPLMTPNRLIKELTQTGVGMPVIGLIRSDERRKGLLDDYEAGLFSYYEPGLEDGDKLLDALTSAKRFHDFKKDSPRTTIRHFTGVGLSLIHI